ncbi:MAG: threonine synthase [bacterium]
MPTPAATTGTAHTRGTHTPKPGDPRLSLAPPTCQAQQVCINPACASTYPVGDTLVSCRACGSLLDVRYRWPWSFPRNWSFLRPMHGAYGHPDASGVWRFRSLLPFFNHPDQIASIGEGRTILQQADLLAEHLGFSPGTLHLQYEGQNPSGSFKDNGMAAAFTHARMVGATVCACASTGNTSASMAAYAAQSARPAKPGTPARPGIKAVIFIGDGKIALGKLSQALDYGALTLQVAGDFDACLARIRHIAEKIPQAGVYLMNSVNPFRLEGQKTIMYRVLEALAWRVPDWIVVPGGNLGNCSAFGKAFIELKQLGLIDRVPRLAVINAAGACTLDRVYNTLGVRWNQGRYFADGGQVKVNNEYARMDAAGERATTIASAIEINRPVNLPKALRALEFMNGDNTTAYSPDGGVVRSVDDQTIRHYKALVGRFGFGCEPASAASLAGAHLLLQQGLIKPGQLVACILTGHILKDPDVTVAYHTKPQSNGPQSNPDPLGSLANAPIKVKDNLPDILTAMGVPAAGLSLG